MALPTVSLHSNGPYWHAVWPDPLNPARRRRRSIGPKRRLSRVEAVSACARIAAEIALEAAGGLPTLDSLDSRIVSTRVGLKPGSLKLLRRSVALLCQWADEALPAGRRSRIDDITRAGATFQAPKRSRLQHGTRTAYARVLPPQPKVVAAIRTLRWDGNRKG